MKALALVDSPDHVCCRYRIRAFLPALEAAGWTLQVEGLARSTIARVAQIHASSRYDAVILQRKLLPSWQLALLRGRARRLVFDFDDAVLFRDSYDPRGSHSARRLARFRRTVRAADRVIAGNAFLAEQAHAAGATPNKVDLIPTCVEPARYTPLLRADPSATLELIWIGSSSTLQGLEHQRPLWERIGAELPDVRMRVVCDRFPRFERLRVIEVPWSEATEAEELARADAGVAWVPDDVWSRGKCGLKVLQYQAAGLPVVANPVGVHPEMVEPGVNGELASTPDEWVRAIGRLARDPERRRRLGAAARLGLTRRYAVDVWSGAFVAALTGVPPLPRSHLRDPAAADGRNARTGAVG